MFEKNFFIAEIGNNHMGDPDIAKKMIKAAKVAGATAVKFQKRDNASLFHPSVATAPYLGSNSFGETYLEHREFLELSQESFRELKKFSDDLGILFFATPFDMQSFFFLEEIGCDLYKIASADIDYTQLIEAVCKTGKPVIISTGAATKDKIKNAADIVKKYGNECAILQCTSIYPCEVEDLNLAALRQLKQIAQFAKIGISDHQSGIAMPIVAHMLGATVFEKHFTLDRSWKGTDQSFSLEPGDFGKMVRNINYVQKAIGKSGKTILPKELTAMSKMRKSLYAARVLPIGHILTESDFLIMCPEGEYTPNAMKHLIGKKVIKSLNKFENFSRHKFE